MRKRHPVTVIIAVKNEEVNIARCLSALGSAKRCIVIDSGSRDATQEIALSCGAEVIQFEYKGGYPKKRQWALDVLEIDTEWVLLLDADEVVPEELWREIRDTISVTSGQNGYLITKQFHFLGRRFRFGGFSFSAVLLFRKGKARFEHLIDEPTGAPDMEVHERLIVDGPLGKLKTPLIHEDFKGMEAYIDKHNHYSTWQARVRRHFLKTGRWGEEIITPKVFGNSQERSRFLKLLLVRLPYEPQTWFIYHYILRLGLLEGRRGRIASRIRANYIAQVRDKMYEMDLRTI